MEIADLVQETLERNGTFSSLKAQLRASVRQIIEGKTGHPTLNPAVARLSCSENGRRVMLLLHEALACLGLEQALLALRAECSSVNVTVFI